MFIFRKRLNYSFLCLWSFVFVYCMVWSTQSQAFPHVVHLDGCVRRLRPSRQWCKVKHVTSSQAKSLMLKSKNVNLQSVPEKSLLQNSRLCGKGLRRFLRNRTQPNIPGWGIFHLLLLMVECPLITPAICSVLSKVDHQVLGSGRNHAVLRGGSTQQLLMVCRHKHYLPSV